MRQIIENENRPNRPMSMTSIEADFLDWADNAVMTTNTDCVWNAAATFLAHRAPEYRTTSNTGTLVRSFLKKRNGRQFPLAVEQKLQTMQQFLTSLENIPKRGQWDHAK